MFLLFKELWPFIREIFFENEELKKDVRQPKFLGKLVLVSFLTISIIYGFWFLFSGALISTYNRNAILSKELRTVERAYTTVVSEKRTMARNYDVLLMELRETKIILNDTTLDAEKIKKERIILRAGLEKCYLDLKRNTPLPNDNLTFEVDKQRPRSRVIDLMKGIE